MKSKPNPKLAQETNPASVPTFPCIVYLRTSPGGSIRGRVANLDGIEAEASSERDLLAKLVPAFKSKVGAFMEEGQPVPWLDPPSDPRDDEQKRFIPVHL